jgi:hypothetical protein
LCAVKIQQKKNLSKQANKKNKPIRRAPELLAAVLAAPARRPDVLFVAFVPREAVIGRVERAVTVESDPGMREHRQDIGLEHRAHGPGLAPVALGPFRKHIVKIPDFIFFMDSCLFAGEADGAEQTPKYHEKKQKTKKQKNKTKKKRPRTNNSALKLAQVKGRRALGLHVL